MHAVRSVTGRARLERICVERMSAVSALSHDHDTRKCLAQQLALHGKVNRACTLWATDNARDERARFRSVHGLAEVHLDVLRVEPHAYGDTTCRS